MNAAREIETMSAHVSYQHREREILETSTITPLQWLWDSYFYFY